jgi:hypothetical protein
MTYRLVGMRQAGAPSAGTLLDNIIAVTLTT